MSFILADLADENHDVQVNGWNWRPTLLLISEFGIIDDERLEMMGYNGSGVRISADEARAIAKLLEEGVLTNLRPGERVLFDLSVTSEPDDFTFDRDNPEKNYSATREWLVMLTEFCRSCGGFTIY